MLIAEHENGYICTAHDWGNAEDYVCGTIRFGGPEDYWHFWPASDCRQLTASDLKILSDKLVELNRMIR